jgi:hypothetical protein
MRTAHVTKLAKCNRTGKVSAFLVAAVAMAAFPRAARAQPPDPDLLLRLSHHAAVLEKLLNQASFAVEQEVNQVDGDGKVTSTRLTTSHVTFDGRTSHETVDRCVKDGQDVTAEQRETVRKAEEKEEADRKQGKKSSEGDDVSGLKIPFLASEQPLYVFDETKVDPADPSRVEISFVPKHPDKSSVEGAAWVSTTDGTILSSGVKLSKPPTFVDFVHLTVEFGEKTPLGPALSRLTFDAKGGFLFLIHKHYKGELKMSDYRVAASP